MTGLQIASTRFNTGLGGSERATMNVREKTAPCPKARDLAAILDEIRRLLIDIEDGLDGVRLGPRKLELAGSACALLRRLLTCKAFWAALYVRGLGDALRRIDADRIDLDRFRPDEITGYLAGLMRQIGDRSHDYTPEIEAHVAATVEALRTIAHVDNQDALGQYKRPEKVRFRMRGQARDAITALRDSICDPASERLIEQQGDDLFQRFRTLARKLMGLITADVSHGRVFFDADVELPNLSREQLAFVRMMSVTYLVLGDDMALIGEPA